MILRWLRAFLEFWKGYIFGDDWTVAAAIAVALVATWLLEEAGLPAWWLLPVVVVAANARSIHRSVSREPPRNDPLA
jgi:glutathione S-transferase